MKALIIGKSGQLAHALLDEKPSNTKVLCLGRSDVDICSIESLDKAILEYSPTVIINASAYTAVDNAESDQEAAYAINQHAVKNMAILAKRYNARFLHVSTDFVFNGQQSKAYLINDEINPCSVYGASKLAGEQEILANCPNNSAIVRTSWLYSPYGNNFVKTMMRLMQEKPELGVVCDQIGCPTSANSLAKFLWKLTALESITPIYHWSDYGVASWYDFAIAIQHIAFDEGLLKDKIPVKPILASSYPTPAKRPNFSLLNACDSYLIEPSSHWSEQLRKCINKLR